MRLDLARNILSILVKKRAAELVKLSASGDKLYVAKMSPSPKNVQKSR